MAISPSTLVQLTQALIARELVDSFGLPERRAAEFLGLVPSAISQYRSGRRLGPQMRSLGSQPGARRIARGVAQELVTSDHPSELAPGLVLAAAREIATAENGTGRIAGRTGASPLSAAPVDRSITEFLRSRIVLEQAAVADCMRLAQKSRDELTRAIFRQIASDSLRHAEIVASLASYLDRGFSSTVATGITRADVTRLIQREHDAESGTSPGLATELGGVMALLWESMESDERKHEVLLQHLLTRGLPRTERPRTAARAFNSSRPRRLRS